jgi:hypothetical protein
MGLEDNKIWGEVKRQDPAPVDDGSTRAVRLRRNGEVAVGVADRWTAQQDGRYFTITGTPGTGIAGHAAATTLDDTKPFVHIFSSMTASDNRRIHLDYLRTWVTAAGTGGTDLRYGIKVDNGSTRRSSGGTLLTATNVNLQSTNTLGATSYAGAVIAAAAGSSSRLVTHGLIRTVINVIGDEYIFTFGRGNHQTPGLASAGTAQYKAHFLCPSVSLGPNDQLLFHFFSTSQSAASSHEVEIGCWVE